MMKIFDITAYAIYGCFITFEANLLFPQRNICFHSHVPVSYILFTGLFSQGVKRQVYIEIFELISTSRPT